MPTNTSRTARLLAAAVVSSVVAAGLVLLVSGQPVSAATTTFDRSSWAYIDSRAPQESHVNSAEDAPVGALRDARGSVRKYRSFFTFEISRLLGTNVSSVTLFTAETQATDCVHRKVELWQTGPVDATTTWKNPPPQQQMLDSAGSSAYLTCPAARVVWKATLAVQQAVAAGQSQVTLELRVPQADEGDTRLGRRFNNDVQMTVVYNTPPDVPADLNVDDLGCSTQQPYVWEGLLAGTTSLLSARVSDPDEGGVSAEFAIWPVDRPDQRTTLPLLSGLSSGSVVRQRVPDGLVVDGTAYGFEARGVDPDNAYSAWSTPCYFQTDYSPPANPPLVSSTDYPSDSVVQGGQGIEGSFTFSANGVSDVVGFGYDFNGGQPTGYVPADHPGGSATATVAPPQGSVNIMNVWSVDRAGNVSDSARYAFPAWPTTPQVSYTGTPHSGRPFSLTFSPAYYLPPGYDTVVSYTYTVNSGPAQMVTAGADGTATVDITFTGTSMLDVRSVSSNGWTSPAYERSFYADTSPSISSATYPEGGSGGGVGQAGMFTFESSFSNSTQFVYSFDSGGTWQTVDAGADGTASVAWTPDTAGDNMLMAYSQTADGTQSDWYFYMFAVNG